MPSDYNKIREDNIRDYGQKTHHLDLLGQLYTDRTHFVLELLQNAEDAGASRILFSLSNDRLEVAHDGRFFDGQDVKGVCGVAEGTKTEDLTQIGKFGVGFKSVYAFTATPEVHSGDESFRIENYVRPSAIPLKLAGGSWTTLFVFPFDSKEVSPSTACKEIGTRLRKLSARTLLFLRKIGEIEYRLPDSSCGVYLREEIPRGLGRQVKVIGEGNNRYEEENWLIFERPVPIPGTSGKVCVEVSFRLETEDIADKIFERIAKVKDSPLVVYFPTEKATGLGFLIQGPYRTTPSRDNIPKDNEWNETLVNETANLVRDILSEIRDLGLLSVSFLEALPIRAEDFPSDSMFYPIFDTVVKEFLEEELLPADDGSFVAAGNAKLARSGELRKLLSTAQLSRLFQSQAAIKWLIGGITLDRTPDVRSYLIEQLGIEELSPDSLARNISNSFLSDQSDEWFIDFYSFLSSQEALWRAPRWERDPGGILRQRPILRLDNGSQDAPFKQDGKTPNAFLPPPEQTIFPVIKRSIVADDRARTFLTHLGLSEPDVFDDIVRIVLPKYVGDAGNLVTDEEHREDIYKIVSAMGSDSKAGKEKVKKAASQKPFIRAANSIGEIVFKKPAEVYLNNPELKRYFSSSQTVWFLHEEGLLAEKAIDALCDLGVSRLPRKLQTSKGLLDSEREHSTRGETFKNFDLDGLEHFLIAIQELSEFEEQKTSATVLWNFLRGYLEQDPSVFKATYEWFFYSPQTKYLNSMIFDRLKGSKWIPTKGGILKQPDEVVVDEMPDEFLQARELIETLGIVAGTHRNEDERRLDALSQETGFSPEELRIMKDNPVLREQIKSLIATRKQGPRFPTRSVANSERRQERLGDQLTDTPGKEYEKLKRSVRVTSASIDPTTWLRNQYTNEDDQMVCQICKEEMPFRKRNGDHYFEKKEVLSRVHLPKEHEAQYLALCPLCAAMYEEFVKKDDDAMADLKDKLAGAADLTVPISLGGHETSIRFVETHLYDLKAIIFGVETSESI